MSKRFLVCLLVGVSSPVCAGSSSFTGMFVGLGGGYSSGSFANKSNFTEIDSGVQYNAEGTTASLSGASGELAIGYGYAFPSCVYLGGDVFGSLSALKGTNLFRVPVGTYPGTSTIVQMNIKETLKMTSSYGLRFRPGFLVGPRTLIHATLGVTSAQFKTDTSADTAIIANMLPQSQKKWRAGFTFGGGITAKMSDRTSIGLEFTHTRFSKVGMNHILDKTVVPQPDVVRYTFKPQENKFMLKFAYHFGGKCTTAAPVAPAA